MERKVIDIREHKEFSKPKLWIPDRPECQVFHLKSIKNNKQCQTVRLKDRLDKLLDRSLELRREAGRVEEKSWELEKKSSEIVMEMENLHDEMRYLWAVMRADARFGTDSRN